MKSNEAKAVKPPGIDSQQSKCGSLTFEDLRILRSPFPKETLGIKVQSLSKERNRAMLVLYLQHTDVQDRLEQVDPAWTIESLREERAGDTVYVYMKMTLKGVSRENVGDGGDPKSAYSDALKRCSMLFGVGRYLYEMSTVWVDYNEQRDRFRTWTIEDYEQAAHGRSQLPAPAATPKNVPSAEKPGLKTSVSPKRPPHTREQLNHSLMGLYRPYLTRFPDTRFVELLQSRYQIGETRLMSLEQIEDLILYMQQQLESAA
jgi:hypothetical protein